MGAGRIGHVGQCGRGNVPYEEIGSIGLAKEWWSSMRYTLLQEGIKRNIAPFNG